MEFSEDLYELFTAGLKLPSQIEENAKQFLKDISPFIQKAFKIHSKTWLACAVYVAVQNASSESETDRLHKKSHADVTISQLLNRANINIMDFFDAMCFLKSNYSLSNKTQQNFIALERKYCIVSALYDKFEKMLNDIFSVEINIQGNHLHELLYHYKSLCWTLFLVAKAKVLWHRQELLVTFHLLLCCIAEVINAAPTFLLLPPFDNIVTTANSTLKVLEVLSNVIGTSFDEVKIVYECWLHVTEELMPESSLLELAELKAKYTDLYLLSGDLDESKFLDRDWHIIPKGADPNSPKKIQPPSVTSTLEASQALRFILLSASNELSYFLKDVFKRLPRSPINTINAFIIKFRHKFLSAFERANKGSDHILVEKRWESARDYYYLMLDVIVKKETSRLSTSDLSIFLNNQTFHQSLLACCTEVVLMCCGSITSNGFFALNNEQESEEETQGTAFPWVLKVFDVKAYHFFKIIDTFIKTCPEITQQIIAHLQTIENQILQSLAWVSDSPVFTLTHNTSEKIEDASASCRSLLPVENGSASTSKNEPVSLSPGVNIFFNKVSRFAYRRVELLCFLLKLADDLQKDIWICMENVIYSKSYILKDHCIDQIIMCCIYAICKIRDREMLFKTIISQYTQLPDASELIYKNVLHNGKKDYIIAFYNRVFATEMKNFITTQFSNDSGIMLLSKATLSPLSPSTSILGRRNIFVSPLKKSPFKNPNEIIFPASSSFDPAVQVKRYPDANEIVKPISPNSKVNTAKRLRYEVEVKCHDTMDVRCHNTNALEKQSLNSVKKILKFDD